VGVIMAVGDKAPSSLFFWKVVSSKWHHQSCFMAWKIKAGKEMKTCGKKEME